jgi:predicted DNA-binding protein YlxM (UPF0122 family)
MKMRWMLAGSLLTLVAVAAVIILGGQVMAQQDTDEGTPEPALQETFEEQEAQDEPESGHHVFSIDEDGLHGKIDIWLDRDPGFGMLFHMDEDLPGFVAEELELVLAQGEYLGQILAENDLTHFDLLELADLFDDFDPGQRLAELLGLTTEELQEAVLDGQSLAEIAEANGIEPQALVDAIVAELQAKMDQAVADGDLDQEQATALLDWFQGIVQLIVNESLTSFHDMDLSHLGEMDWPDFDLDDMDWGGFGLHEFTFTDPLTVAAETIGITHDELMQALMAGQSLEEIAEEHGVDPQAVKDAMSEAMKQGLGDLPEGFPHIELESIFEGMPHMEMFMASGFFFGEHLDNCCPCDQAESGE